MSENVEGLKGESVGTGGVWGALTRMWSGDDEREREREREAPTESPGTSWFGEEATGVIRENLERMMPKRESPGEIRGQAQQRAQDASQTKAKDDAEEARRKWKQRQEEERKKKWEEAQLEAKRKALLTDPMHGMTKEQYELFQKKATEGKKPEEAEKAKDEALTTEFLSSGNRSVPSELVGAYLPAFKQAHAEKEWGYEGPALGNKEFLERERAHYDLRDRVTAAGGVATLFKLDPVEAREAALHHLQSTGHPGLNPKRMDSYRGWFHESMDSAEESVRTFGPMVQRMLPGFSLGSLFTRPPEPEMGSNGNVVVRDGPEGRERTLARKEAMHYTVADRNVPLRGLVKAVGDNKLYFPNETERALLENRPVPQTHSSVWDIFPRFFRGAPLVPNSQPGQTFQAFSGVEQTRRDKEARYEKDSNLLWQGRVSLLEESGRRAQEILSEPTDEKTKDKKMRELRADSGRRMAQLSDDKNKLLRELHADVMKGEVSVQDYLRTGQTLGIWDVTVGKQGEPPQDHAWEDQVTEVARLKDIPGYSQLHEKLDTLDATYAKDMAAMESELEKGGGEGISAAEALTDHYLTQRKEALKTGSATYKEVWRVLATFQEQNKGKVQSPEYELYLNDLRADVEDSAAFLGGAPAPGTDEAYDRLKAKHERELDLQKIGSSSELLRMATALVERHGVPSAEVERILKVIDLTSDWENGDKARRLPSGDIMVNPSEWSDVAQYRAAVDAVDASPEAKRRALEMFPKLKAEALEAVFTKLSGFEDFDEELRKYPGTTEEALTKFIADANKNPKWTKHINRVWAGLTGILTNTAGLAAAATGSDTAHDAMRVLHEQQEAFETKASLAKTGPVADFTSRVAGGATSLLPVMGSARVAGLGARLFGAGMGGIRAAATAGMTLGAVGQSFGGGYDAAVHHLTQQGVPEAMARRQALKPAVINGLVTGVITYWGRNSGVEPFLRGQAGRELVKRTLWEQGKAMGRDYLKEFGEEGLDQMAQGFVAKMTYHPGKSLHDIFAEAWDAAAIGGVLGGGMSGAGAVSENAAAWWSGGNGASADAANNAMNNRAPGAMDSTGPDGDIWKPHIAEGEYGDAGSADAQAAGQNGASGGDAELSFSMGTQPSMVRPIDNPTSNATLQGDEARNPKAIFRALTGEEAKEGNPGADGRATSGQRRKPGRRIASLADVMAWAHTNGRVLAPEKFRLEEAESGGNEHLVFPADESGRVVKITKPGLVGAQGEDAGAYILRWALANEAFGDDVKIEGIVQLPGEHAPRVVISQPFYEGRDATDIEIRDYFRQKGFHEHEGQWIHPIRRIKIWDNITEGNVIKTETGAMAVDLQVERASNADVRAVSEATGFGRESSFSLATTIGDFFPEVEVVQRGVSAEDAAELQRRLNATPIGRALLEGALIVPDRASLDGREGRPSQSNYSEKNWRDMERAEGFHDPREGGLAAAVFLNNVEVRRGETPLEAVGRVLSHERMGHKEFNKLLKTVPELSQRWQQLVTHIPEEQLKALRQRYKDVDGREEAPSLEWFADRAGALDSRKQLQPGSLLDQMWQTVSDVFRTILEPLSRDPSKKMSQEALDAHVRAFLRRMRKNMLEEAKGGSAGINGNAARGTLLGGGIENVGGRGARTTGDATNTSDEMNGVAFGLPLQSPIKGGPQPPLTAMHTPRDKGINKSSDEDYFNEVREAKNDLRKVKAQTKDWDEKKRKPYWEQKQNEVVEKFYGNLSKVIQVDTQVDFFTRKPVAPEDRIFLVMPSGSGDNDLPHLIAKRLEKDGLGKTMQVKSFAVRADADGNTTESKKQKGYVAKMEIPGFKTKDGQDPQRWVQQLKGKHIILVDDIVTTGEGIEAVRMYLQSLDPSLDLAGVAALAVKDPQVVTQMKDIEVLAKTLTSQLEGRVDLGDLAKYVENPALMKQLLMETHGRSRRAILERAEKQATNKSEDLEFVSDPDAAKKVLETLVKRSKLLKKD